MRDLYATTLQLVHVGGGAAFDVACKRSMKWAWRVDGKIPDLTENPSGQASKGEAGGEVAVAWSMMGSAAARALEIELRHPHDRDPTIRWHAVVAISDVRGATRATVRLGLDATVHSLRPVRLSLRAPGLVPSLMRAPLQAYSGSMELGNGVRVLAADDAESLVQDELEAEGRALPILICSSRVKISILDEISRGLAGLAQVVRARDQAADEAFTVALSTSGFTIPSGGLRLFWPGFGTSEGASREPYWTAVQLRSRRNLVLDQLVRIIAPISAARVPPDPGMIAARQEALRVRRDRQSAREQAQRDRARRQRENAKRAMEEARRSAGEDESERLKEQLAETGALLDQAENERDEADNRVEEAEASELGALEEAEALGREVESLRSENAGLQRNLKLISYSVGESDEAEQDEVPEEVSTWEEVAGSLEDLEGPGFVVTDRAQDCASLKNRYPTPGTIWRALRDLERTGRAYNEMGAELGMRFEEFAMQQAGLDVALQDSTYESHLFEFENQTYSRLPHVKIDDAKSPNEVGRIYFALDKEGKRVIVDWFGTKPDRP